MTYYDSAEEIMITKDRALKEFKAHGMDYEAFEEFLMDIIADPSTELCHDGNIVAVDAQATLAWLGY